MVSFQIGNFVKAVKAVIRKSGIQRIDSLVIAVKNCSLNTLICLHYMQGIHKLNRGIQQ